MNAGLGPGTTLPAQQTHAEEGPSCSRTPPTHFLTASHPSTASRKCNPSMWPAASPSQQPDHCYSFGSMLFFFPVFIELH